MNLGAGITVNSHETSLRRKEMDGQLQATIKRMEFPRILSGHWRIPRGGGGGWWGVGALGMRVPSQSNYFQFHAVFGKKMVKIICWLPTFGICTPVWEILYLPLLAYTERGWQASRLFQRKNLFHSDGVDFRIFLCEILNLIVKCGNFLIRET